MFFHKYRKFEIESLPQTHIQDAFCLYADFAGGSPDPSPLTMEWSPRYAASLVTPDAPCEIPFPTLSMIDDGEYWISYLPYDDAPSYFEIVREMQEMTGELLVMDSCECFDFERFCQHSLYPMVRVSLMSDEYDFPVLDLWLRLLSVSFLSSMDIRRILETLTDIVKDIW